MEFVVHSRKGRTEDRMDSSVPTEKQARDLDYQSPERILAPVRAYCGGQIGLDPATLSSNPTRAAHIYTPTENGLAQTWSVQINNDRAVVYVNAPYGRELERWLAKIAESARSGVTILALLPASRFEQKYWHDYVLDLANAACFIRKRLAFRRPTTGEVAKGNPYASILFGYNVDRPRFARCFGTTLADQKEPLGKVVYLDRPEAAF